MRNSMLRLSALLVSTALLGCASSTTQRTSDDYYFDDSVITLKVETALLNERSLESSAVVVETVNRIVSLSGFVNSQAEIDTATAVARSIGGVQSVKNKIRVKPS
jgi:osmotically-inducible protein OsmY